MLKLGATPVVKFLRRPSGIMAAGSFLVTLAYTTWVLGTHFNPLAEPLVSSLLLVLLSALFAVLALHLYENKELALRERYGWLLLGLGGLCNAIAEFFWFYEETILKKNPFVSSGDVFFFLYYPLLLAGVLTFPHVRVRKGEREILWLDLGIVLTTSFMVLWYFFLARTSQHGMALTVAIYYPVGGFLILMALVDLIQRGAERIHNWTLLFLATGIASGILADGFLGYFETSGSSFQMFHLNIFWLFAQSCMITGAACHQLLASDASAERRPPHRLLRLAFPYVSIAVGLVLLVLVVYSTGVSEMRKSGILVGVLILVILVLFRQYVVLRENIQLFQEMQQLAVTDALTSIYNRHHINEMLQREVKRAQRHGHLLSVLLIDVNGFKTYNDRFGHLRGDEVLKTIAQLLAAQVRSTDVLGRFGGDEFVAILPDTGGDGARVVAEKMRTAVAGAQLAETALGVTVGVATFHPQMTGEQLLEEADVELYKMKPSKKPGPEGTSPAKA